MRLFIAIELPAELKEVLGTLRSDLPGARWVAAEQMHLTLAFLGEQEDGSIEPLRKELARIHLPPFTLTLTGIGSFPHRQRPRVLWVGVAPQPALIALVVQVQDALRACGLVVEERPFAAHLTLARLKVPAPRAVGAFLDQSLPRLPAFVVTEFILFQSTLTPHGAEHLPFLRFPLATG